MTESTDPSRGEVWLVRFGANQPGEPGKNRPALVVSVDELKTGSDRDGFVVVPISATEPESLMRPTIAPADSGLDRPSVAVPSAVRAVSRQRLLRHVGTVGPDVLGAVEHALAIVLGIDE